MTHHNDILKATIQKIERLESDKQDIMDDMKVVWEEAKAEGLDVKIAKQIVRERKKGREELQAELDTLDEYRNALGMLAGTPLGDAAAPNNPYSNMEGDFERDADLANTPFG